MLIMPVHSVIRLSMKLARQSRLQGRIRLQEVKLYLFTGNETKQYQIKPVIVDENRDRLVAGVPYTGSITFGIALAEAE